jgi:hypothetical protein
VGGSLAGFRGLPADPTGQSATTISALLALALLFATRSAIGRTRLTTRFS